MIQTEASEASITIIPKGSYAEVRVMVGEHVMSRLLLDQKGLTILVLQGREVLNQIKDRL